MKRGRPPGTYKTGGAGVHLGVQYSLYMSEAQRDKLGKLGGAKWIRDAIDRADLASSVRKGADAP